jgi:hypothetical protein
MNNSVILYKIQKYQAKLSTLNVGDVEKRNVYNQKLSYYEMLGGAPGQCNPTEYSNLRKFLINYFNNNETTLNNVFDGNYGSGDKLKRFTWGIYRKTLLPNMPIPDAIHGDDYNTTPMSPQQIDQHGKNVNLYFYPPILAAYKLIYTKTPLQQNNTQSIAQIKECFRTINREMLQNFLRKPYNGVKFNDNDLMDINKFKIIFTVSNPQTSRQPSQSIHQQGQHIQGLLTNQRPVRNQFPHGQRK